MAILVPTLKRLGCLAKWPCAALAFLLLGAAYLALVPTPPEYSARQLKLVDNLADEVSAWVSSLDLARGSAAFGNLERDPFAVVSAPLRQAAWRTDRFDLLERPFIEKLREQAHWTLPTVEPDRELAEWASGRRADYALGGRIERFADDGSRALLVVRMVVWDVATRELLAEHVFTLEKASLSAVLVQPPMVGHETSAGPPVWRLLCWVGVVVLLPFTLLLDRSVLEDGSSGLLGTLLIVLVSISGMVAHLLADGVLAPFWATLSVLIAVGVAAVYDYRLMVWLKENLA